MKRTLPFVFLLFFTTANAKSFFGLQVDGELSTGRNEIEYELALKPSIHTAIKDDIELATQLMFYHSIDKEDFVRALSPLKNVVDWHSNGMFSNIGGHKGAIEVHRKLKRMAGL